MRQLFLAHLALLFAVLIVSSCEPEGRLEKFPRKAGAAGPAASDLQTFVLQTGVVDGRMVYIGVGGEIDGKVNPDLVINPGPAVHLTLLNRDGLPHDLSIPDFGVQSPIISGEDAAVQLDFRVTESQTGSHGYFCTLPGHRQAGMAGSVIVAASPTAGG